MADVFSSLPIEVPVAAGKVIVVGGSVGGLFAAVWLQQAGWQTAL
jgi:monoamine oxidase